MGQVINLTLLTIHTGEGVVLTPEKDKDNQSVFIPANWSQRFSRVGLLQRGRLELDPPPLTSHEAAFFVVAAQVSRTACRPFSNWMSSADSCSTSEASL